MRAAAGISATFNAPIAGVFFALELILRDFAAESFGVVVLSSVLADVVGRAAFGGGAFLHLPAFSLRHPAEYLLYALLGVLAGVGGVVFTRVLYGIEDVCDRAWRGPEWARPAVGGLLLGGLLLVLPQMYGVGYPVLENGIDGRYAVGFLLLLFLGKMLATSLTIGIGGSGGVFAPSLFCGAMLGTAYGLTAHSLLPGTVGTAGAYGLIGMAAVFAGSARAPITAVLIIFELTGEYTIILPLMLAVVPATVVSTLLSKDTIYTLKLTRRGINLDQPRPAGPLATLHVAQAMTAAPPPVAGDASLAALSTAFGDGRHRCLPVLTGDRAYLGVVTAQAVAEALTNLQTEAPPGAAALLEAPPALRADDTLEQSLDLLLGDTSGIGLPVLDSTGASLLGWLTHADVLRAYHHTQQPDLPAPHIGVPWLARRDPRNWPAVPGGLARAEGSEPGRPRRRGGPRRASSRRPRASSAAPSPAAPSPALGRITWWRRPRSSFADRQSPCPPRVRLDRGSRLRPLGTSGRHGVGTQWACRSPPRLSRCRHPERVRRALPRKPRPCLSRCRAARTSRGRLTRQ